MIRILLMFALLCAPSLFAYDGNSFPLDGLRFQGYEGTDRKSMYEFGWFVLWIGWPLLAFFFLSIEKKGAITSLISFVLGAGLILFWICNLDYFIGYTLGLIIFGGACAASQGKKLFS